MARRSTAAKRGTRARTDVAIRIPGRAGTGACVGHEQAHCEGSGGRIDVGPISARLRLVTVQARLHRLFACIASLGSEMSSRDSIARCQAARPRRTWLRARHARNVKVNAHNCECSTDADGIAVPMRDSARNGPAGRRAHASAHGECHAACDDYGRLMERATRVASRRGRARSAGGVFGIYCSDPDLAGRCSGRGCLAHAVRDCGGGRASIAVDHRSANCWAPLMGRIARPYRPVRVIVLP